MQKRHYWAAVLAAGFVTIGLAGSAYGGLTDMVGHWSAPLVAALESRGIVAGDLDGRFNPDVSLTRAQLAKLFVAGLGNEGEATLLSRYPSRYTDIPTWHWAKGYIEALSEIGLTDGYPDGSFGPGDSVTRAQMAVFLVRATGRAEEAQLMRLMPTEYQDDGDIPPWARGYVYVARTAGLMAGFPDGSFRPLQPVTKAEGGVTLLRLMARKGLAYNLSGTLVRFDAATGTGLIRDALGVEQPFTMARDAQFYRAGLIVPPDRISRADQVWVVFGQDGQGRFLEARYLDVLATSAKLSGSSVKATLPDGGEKEYALQPGALFFANGQPAAARELAEVGPAYLVLDAQTGDVRLVDAVKPSFGGRVVGVNLSSGKLIVSANGNLQSLSFASNAILYLNGNPASLADVHLDDRVWGAVDGTGLLMYLQAER